MKMTKAEAAYLQEILEMLEDGSLDPEELFEYPETADGCLVEPDGVCEHGFSSPLLLLGVI